MDDPKDRIIEALKVSQLDLRAENARLQTQVEEAEERVLGMQEEGCAALGLVENIFNGLTAKGKPTEPMPAQIAEAIATLLTEATPCGHKADSERRKGALMDWPCLACKRNSPNQPDYNPEQFEIDHQYDTRDRARCLNRRAAIEEEGA